MPYRLCLMPTVLDIEQQMMLLELEPPFDKRAVQLARRKMAKRWHPDLAPPGKQPEHERHLKAINEAADQLERMAESLRGGRVSRNAVRASAAAARKAREEAGRAPTKPSSARGRARRRTPSTIRSAAGCPTTRWCTATRAACPTRSGGWGRWPGSTSPATAPGRDRSAAVGAGEVQPRHPHGARGQHALRGLLQTRPRGRADGALHGRRAARDGRRRIRAGGEAAGVRARSATGQRRACCG